MFDDYEPDPAPTCPRCGAAFVTWQGKDGPNFLFVWRQGERLPVDQPIDEGSRIDRSRYSEFALPATFRVDGWCENDHQFTATGLCVDGVWREFGLGPESQLAPHPRFDAAPLRDVQ